MNITHYEHLLWAWVIQGCIGGVAASLGSVFDMQWLIASSLWLGAVAATGFFIGREHAQREYHIGDPSTIAPWAAFDVWDWSRDSVLDVVFPAVGTFSLASIWLVV